VKSASNWLKELRPVPTGKQTLWDCAKGKFRKRTGRSAGDSKGKKADQSPQGLVFSRNESYRERGENSTKNLVQSRTKRGGCFCVGS